MATPPQPTTTTTKTTTTTTTTFQLLSDLHLETTPDQYPTYTIPARAPHLLLAGDIGSLAPSHYPAYLAFLARHTARFTTVLLVLGNHEFWDCPSPAAAIAAARRLEHEPCLRGRLVLLHRRRYDVPGSRVTVLGCTLWSAVPEEAREAVGGRVRDFGRIGGWSLEKHDAAHAVDVAWLRGEVAAWEEEEEEEEEGGEGGGERSLVVVTHHAPSLRGMSSPRNAGNVWGSAFATELLLGEGSEEWAAVKVWVFGHTHFSTEFERSGVRVVSNQRGYGGRGDGAAKGLDESGFDVEKVIHV